MKRFISLFWAIGLASVMFAQLPGGDGFYRVRNVDTERYITVNEDVVRGSKMNPDLSSLVTVAGFENVVSDPASVIYFQNVPNYNHSVRFYDLFAQGTDTYTLSQGRHIEIQGTEGNYKAYASESGFSKYLFDSDDEGGYGKVVTQGTDGTKRRDWDIIPINHESGKFFGFASDVNTNGGYYSTILASFGFRAYSSGMKFYYIDEVDVEQGMAILKEINGDIPAGMPVIVECSSYSAADNMVDIFRSSGGVPSDNLLTGSYFANRIAYKANTMRVLGKAPDGSLAFVKAQTTYLERNKAYLVVPAGSPDVIKVVTRDFYENEINHPIVVTVDNVTREYGQSNPKFTYTVEGGELNGEPVITCAADESSSVKDGPFEISIAKGSIINKNVTLKSGLLTIAPSTLYVYADDYERFSGEENPAFSMSISGFVNGDTEDVISEKPTIVCTADKTSAPGEYDITPVGGVADNYVFENYSGVLTVYARKITVNDATRVYGDSNPAFTYEPSDLLDNNHQPVIYCEATETSPVGVYSIDVDEEETPLEDFEYISGSLTVTKAPLKITVEEAVRKQGEENPTFTLKYEGFKNNETENALDKKPVVTCAATKDSEPGIYDILVSGAESQNYEITYVKGKLTVSQADGVSLVAKSYEREYGEENPAFEFISDGASLEGTPEITCEATATSPVGTYPIIIRKGSVKNYNVTYVKGTLTITKAPLTVKAGEYTKKQGEENPEFTLTYEGFKNNENQDVLTKQPEVACEATTESAPGEYIVTVSGAEAQNYDITYENGTLTVIEADAVFVTASDYTIVYGDAIPAFEYTVSGAELEGTPVITCEATAASPAGTYPIIVRKGNVKNYNVTYVKGTLTITKAPLTIKAGEYTKKQGEENPEFTLTYEGFKNNETNDVLTKQPEVACEATTESAPGEYIVTVSGAEAQNYEISYVAGKLTITPTQGVNNLSFDGNSFDIYDVQGRKVRHEATSLDNLPKGIYIVNGKKVMK